MNLDNYLNTIEDTFPLIEKSILVLDKYLPWWKNNYKSFENLINNKISKLTEDIIDIKINFIFYSGPDDYVKSVTLNSPAFEFVFLETSSTFVKELKKSIGKTWEGRRLITDENKLIILFE
jgi:hypothetical protein